MLGPSLVLVLVLAVLVGALAGENFPAGTLCREFAGGNKERIIVAIVGTC